MHTDTHTGLDSPKGIWWKPAHKAEKVWVAHRLRLVHGAVRDDAALALEGRAEPVRASGSRVEPDGVRRARQRVHQRSTRSARTAGMPDRRAAAGRRRVSRGA